MIDQARINELRRIYGGSNNEAYRTVNQLLDEVERLREERAEYQSPLEATALRVEPPISSPVNESIQSAVGIPTAGEPTILGIPVAWGDSKSLGEMMNESQAETNASAEEAQTEPEPKETNDDSKHRETTRKTRKAPSAKDGAKSNGDDIGTHGSRST